MLIYVNASIIGGGGYSYTSGGYAKSGSRRKSYRKGSGMSYRNVYNTIKRYNWKTRETKMLSTYVAEGLINTVSASGAYVYPFPAPVIGTAANQRIGNKVDGVGIKANIIFHSNVGITTVCRMLIIGVPQGANFFDSDIIANLFDLSQPSTLAEVSAAPTGLLSDINRQINRNDLKVIRDEVVPLYGTSIDTGFAQRIKYVKTPGRIVYQDSDPAQPMTMRYVMVLIPRQGNADESTGSNIEISYALTMYFKDV